MTRVAERSRVPARQSEVTVTMPGQTIMKDVLTVDALSTILLLTAIEAMYPRMRLIHVFLDNARYHHANFV